MAIEPSYTSFNIHALKVDRSLAENWCIVNESGPKSILKHSFTSLRSLCHLYVSQLDILQQVLKSIQDLHHSWFSPKVFHPLVYRDTWNVSSYLIKKKISLQCRGDRFSQVGTAISKGSSNITRIIAYDLSELSMETVMGYLAPFFNEAIAILLY